MSKDEFTKFARELQYNLALSETDDRCEPHSQEWVGLQIIRLRNLKVKMYQERGHSLPHLHVDYGREHHVASFGIDPPQLLEGKLDLELQFTVESWISRHKESLLALWDELQAGGCIGLLLAEIAAENA
ncbi:DUF4160 domain-containing protein [Lysobacter firmicutimachus]|uniref:DUF4160 domain-containing protein n=1 Tax=Lysobacter firmicutimachus TaxID=1792846 RepID=A0AAU8MV91_9GAMM